MVWNRVKQKLFSGETGTLFKGIVTLAWGTGLARLIGIVSIPIVTRLYSPEDHGLLSVYVSLVLVIAPVLSMRYILAIPLPSSDAVASNLLILSLGITCIMALFLSGLLWMLWDPIVEWIGVSSIHGWLWLVILGALTASIYETMTLWAVRRRSYSIISRTKIVQSLLGEGVKVGFGVAGIIPFGLLLGQAVSQGGGIGSLYAAFKGDLKWRGGGWRKGKAILRRYKGFPIYRLPSQLLLAFSLQGPLIFAAALYGANFTGQLGLAMMALALPSNLIGQSVGQAFYGEIARLPKEGASKKLWLLTRSVQLRLLIIGVPIALLVLLGGEKIFSFGFGDRWAKAGEYASLLSPFILLQLTSGPLVQLFNVLEAQVAFLFVNILRSVGLCAIYIICKYSGVSESGFVWILSFFLFFFYAGMSLYIVFVVRRKALTSEGALDNDRPL